MGGNPTNTTLFSRRKLILKNGPVRQAHQHMIRQGSPEFSHETSKVPVPKLDRQYTVLVINSSHSIAKEITIELTLQIPGCSIMYAPTIELARWLLNRRKIDLVVSCPLLPDGSISRLKETLHAMQQPPDLVVVGTLNAGSAEIMSDTRYEIAALRRLGGSDPAPIAPLSAQTDLHARERMKQTIKDLGADLRNDLNNPLQEIVAMVFVAQAGGTSSAEATGQALAAIDKAARNMATVVNKLEDKIMNAVQR
jgi:hypothetical protein